MRRKYRYEYRQTVSPSKQDKQILPDTGHPWRYMSKDGIFYYAFDNLPAKIKEQIGDPAELLNQVQSSDLRSEVEQRIEALEPDYWMFYRGYNNLHQQRLARAAAALEVCIELGSGMSHWMRYAALMEQMQVQYLPKTWRRLQEKVAEVQAGKPVHEVITLPRVGNANARKFDDETITAWLLAMRNMPQNFTNAYIQRKVALLCDLHGKQTPSESWMAAQLAQQSTKFLTAGGRYGARGKQGQTFKTYAPIAGAIHACDAWQIDGTRANLLPFRNELGKEEFPYMVIVRDVSSGAVIGGYFGRESKQAYFTAVANAARFTGCLPYELIIDRFPGHNTAEWQLLEARLRSLGTKVSKKHNATGKAQVERWFETLQSVFFQDSPWYYGEGVQSRRAAAHRSAEYLKSAKKALTKEGWSRDDAEREIVEIIKKYNNTRLSDYSRKHRNLGKSPMELFVDSERPNSVTLDDATRTLLFGSLKKVGIRNNMLRTEIEGAEYLYNIEDYNILRNFKQVLLAFDLENLDRVYLYHPDDAQSNAPRLLGLATEQERILVHGPNADYKALGKFEARRNRINESRAAEVDAYTQLGANEVNMLLNGMGQKNEAEDAESAWLLGGVLPADTGETLRVIDNESEERRDVGDDLNYLLSQL